MAARLFVIVGPPGSGKSKLIELIRAERVPGLDGSVLTKETSRRPREDEGTEIRPVSTTTTIHIEATEALLEFVRTHSQCYEWNEKTSELKLKGPMLYDEVLDLLDAIGEQQEGKHEVDRMWRDANVLSEACDVIYEQYTRRYGFALNGVAETLARGQSMLAIVNDIRAVREIRAVFGPLAVVLFMYRPLPDFGTLQAERGAMGPNGTTDLDDAGRREEKTKVILRRYVDNIEIFDHVLLNTEDSVDDLLAQMSALVHHYVDADRREYKAGAGIYE